jgi:threonine dehydratase
VNVLDVTPAEVAAAAARIGPHVHRTPLERSAWLSDAAGVDILLKLESCQRTRSFKVRGAFNAILSLAADGVHGGLVTASAGNHGQAVALAGHTAGLDATVFVPADAPETKKQRILAFGARLNDSAADYDAAERLARAHAESTGARFIHAYSDRDVVAGQGTVGLELLEQFDGLTEVIVPVGGGGLIAGVGAVVRGADPRMRVVGVQSSETRGMYDAFAAGGPTAVTVTPTLADGLAGGVDAASYERARAVVNDLVLVDEALLAPAIRQLYERDGVVAEGAAATGVAAIATGLVRPRGPTALVITGGNIDARRLACVLTEVEGCPSTS